MVAVGMSGCNKITYLKVHRQSKPIEPFCQHLKYVFLATVGSVGGGLADSHGRTCLSTQPKTTRAFLGFNDAELNLWICCCTFHGDDNDIGATYVGTLQPKLCAADTTKSTAATVPC